MRILKKWMWAIPKCWIQGSRGRVLLTKWDLQLCKPTKRRWYKKNLIIRSMVVEQAILERDVALMPSWPHVLAAPTRGSECACQLAMSHRLGSTPGACGE